MSAVLQEAAPQLRVIPGSKFVAAFPPLEHVIDGLLPRKRVISYTSHTGSGKTAIGTLMELSIAAGVPFAGRDTVVGGGRVLALVGESPEDKAMRLAAQAAHMGLGADVLDRILIVPDVIDLEARFGAVEQIVQRYGSVAAVTIDTAAAYFPADNENDNVAMRRYAASFRWYTDLPGDPAVLVLAHPSKSATKDNLEPRGGGAFLAEVDGNLTGWKEDALVTLHHHTRKWRFPTFDPVTFELRPAQLDAFTDRKGRPVQSVIAVPAADERIEQIQEKHGSDQDVLLKAMQRNPNASLRALAMGCGWVTAAGKPLSSRVERVAHALKAPGLTSQDRKGTWFLTPKGLEEAAKVRL